MRDAATPPPIVTALTVAVCEAADVCRWPALPDLYSRYGSRGITLLAFLQSWSQGVDAWGRGELRKLWSAASVKVYSGGVFEVEFLDELSPADRGLPAHHRLHVLLPQRKPIGLPPAPDRPDPRRR